MAFGKIKDSLKVDQIKDSLKVDQIRDMAQKAQAEKEVREREKLARKLEKKGKSLDLHDRAGELYDKAVEDGLFTAHFNHKKSSIRDTVTERIENMLMTLRPDERILSVMVVGMNTSAVGLTLKPVPLIVTDTRLIYESKNAVTGGQKAVQLRDVSDVTVSKFFSARGIVIDSLQDKIDFGLRTDAEATACVNAIQDGITAFREKSSAPAVIQASSVADELIKYKQLLDAGAITQEEFDRKKAELL